MAVLCFHVAGLLILWPIIHWKKLTWRAAFDPGWRGWPAALGMGSLLYLSAMPFVIISALVYQLVLSWFGLDMRMQNVVQIFMGLETGGGRLLVGSLAVIVAPVFEEALFRGIGVPVFARGLGTAGAVVVTSTLFALFHFNAASFLPLFVLAVAFALAYIWTGTLAVPMVMHALFNGVNLLLLQMMEPT